MKEAIQTQKAPAAIGSYSQAIEVGNTVYLSGQIPLDPISMTLVSGGIAEQVKQVFVNLQAMVEAAKKNINEIVKLNVFLIDLSAVKLVNEAIAEYFSEPYPARTTIQVVALPKDALVEIDAILVSGSA